MKARRLLRACCLAAAFLTAGDAPAQTPVENPQPATSLTTHPAGAIYDPDPQHLWNRLHAAFYRRDVEEPGKPQPSTLGPAVLDPPLGLHSRYLLDQVPFAQCDSVLEEFSRARGAELFTDPLKRVILQRDLWAVFDLLQPENANNGDRNFGDAPPPYTPAQQGNRENLSRKLARAIAALALSRAQCERLPDTYALALQSGTFPKNPNDAAPQEKADYLPADLFAAKSPWLEAIVGPDPTQHTALVDRRSVFRIFYRPPPDPAGAAKFAAWILERQRLKAAVDPKHLEAIFEPGNLAWERLRQGVPAGTQFLLLRQLIAIDDQWNLIPTRIVESVQVRVFQPALAEKNLRIADAMPAHLASFVRQSAQLFEEFELDRARLFRGESGGLHPTAAGTNQLMGYTGLGRLATDREGRGPGLVPFPFACAICHTDEKAAAAKSHSPMRIMSLEFADQLLPSPRKNTAATSTIEGKRIHPSFRSLREVATAPASASGK